MSDGLVLDSDIFAYIKFHFQPDLAKIESDHGVSLELDSPTQLLYPNASAVTNSNDSSYPISKCKVLLKPFKSDALNDLRRLAERILSQSARFAIPVPPCLFSMKAEELHKTLVDMIRSSKQSNLSFQAFKFFVSHVEKTNVAGAGAHESVVRGIWERDRTEYVEEVLQVMMRRIALQSIDKSPSIQAFFAHVNNVEQFFFNAKHNTLDLKVYTADLTRLPLDAIVSSSDERLSFQAGAAKAIAAKAGTVLV